MTEAKRPDARSRIFDPEAAFLWLLAISVGAAIYLYRIDVLWTVLLTMCAALFLGLFTFAAILSATKPQTMGEVELESLDDE